jgi:hypothetical protein
VTEVSVRATGGERRANTVRHRREANRRLEAECERRTCAMRRTGQSGRVRSSPDPQLPPSGTYRQPRCGTGRESDRERPNDAQNRTTTSRLPLNAPANRCWVTETMVGRRTGAGSPKRWWVAELVVGHRTGGVASEPTSDPPVPTGPWVLEMHTPESSVRDQRARHRGDQ